MIKTTYSPIIKAFCTQYSTRIQEVIKKAKRLYYNELIKASRNENKTLWKITNKETCKSNLTKNIPMEFNFGNSFQINPANVFNKYYLNIIDDQKIQEANIESTKFSLNEAFCQGFAEIINIPITDSEVKCTFKLLKNKNSSGYDGISNKIMKAGCDHISKPLTNILNMSLTQGIYSNQLKYSIIKSVYKHGDKAQISIYRLVFVLNGCSKIMEIVISRRLKKHLGMCNILTSEQYGF